LKFGYVDFENFYYVNNPIKEKNSQRRENLKQQRKFFAMELLFIDCQFQKLAFDSEYEYLKQWD